MQDAAGVDRHCAVHRRYEQCQPHTRIASVVEHVCRPIPEGADRINLYDELRYASDAPNVDYPAFALEVLN